MWIKKHFIFLWVFGLVILPVLLILTTTLGWANVTLIYFRAISQGNNSVLIEWETATEIDTLGFILMKKSPGEQEYQPYGDFIFSKGDSVTGAYYSIVDNKVNSGSTYFYKLIEIDNNTIQIEQGVVSVTVGQPTVTKTPTRTATVTKTAVIPTSTQTRTQTITPTGSSISGSTATSTRTRRPSGSENNPQPRSPTATLVPGQAQINPTSSNNNTNDLQTTISADTTVTGDDTLLLDQSSGDQTPTFIPLPSLTFIYPETPTPENKNSDIQDNSEEEKSGISRWFTRQGLTIIGLVTVIWLALGGWFILSFRRLD